jgi:hypothetical protein
MKYLQDILKSLPPIASPSQIPIPNELSLPIEHLKVADGFACTMEGCRYCAATVKSIQKHSRQCHPHHSGVRPVKMQSFFDATQSPYFEVSELSPHHLLLPPDISKQIAAYQAHFAKLQSATEEASHFVEGDLRATEETPWLRCTGFTKHLHGLQCNTLRVRSRIPYANQLQECPPRLLLHQCLESIFNDVCSCTARVDPGVLAWLASDDTSTPAHRPFSQVQEKSTWKRYTKWWFELIFYLYSVWEDIRKSDCPTLLAEKFQHCFDQDRWDSMNDLFRYCTDACDIDQQEMQSKLLSFLLMILKQE